MPAKVVIWNSMAEELNKVPYIEFDKYSIKIDEDKIFDENSEYFFTGLKNVVVLVLGQDTWHKVRKLHDRGLIHIGLRHFNFSTVTSITYVTLANNVKLVVSPGYIDNKPDWSKIEVFRDSDFDAPVPTIDDWDIVDLKDSEKVIQKLKERTKPSDFLGFDFETRGFPLRSGFKPLGFSIVGRDYGFYVDIRNYTDWNSEVYKPVRTFIEENYQRLVVYNCRFEISVCEHIWGEKLNFPDAMALVLCDDYRLPMRAPKRYVPGLKPCAQHYLHVSSWDDALEFEQKYFGNMCYRYESAEQYFEHMMKNERVDITKDVSVNLRDALVKVMNEAVSRYAVDKDLEEGSEEYLEASKRVKKEYKERIIKAWGNEWEMSDPYTLGKYCIYDSFYTKLIWDYLKDKYPRAEEIYHGNYHYGAFIEDTAIPINRKRLDVLKGYAERVKANTGVFLVKFYLKCLEDTISDYVDNELALSDESKRLMVEMPWTLAMEPYKALKEVIKYCKIDIESFEKEFPLLDYDSKSLPLKSIDWKKVMLFTGKPLAREIYTCIQYDSDVASALRKHRKNWEEFGAKFLEISNYKDIMERINQRNMDICKPYMKEYNADIKRMVSPYDPNACKLAAFYFEDKKLQREPWKVRKDYPDIVTKDVYDFVEAMQKEWHDDYWSTNYLGGRDFKKMMSYINDSLYEKGLRAERGDKDLDIFKRAFNFYEALPTTLLLELPCDELVSMKEVVDLIRLRELKPVLDKWDSVKIDGEFPEGIDYSYAKWLSEDVVKWSSEDETRIVAWSMTKKYGWLCSAITQFWNYWWSPEHKGNEDKDPEVLDYAINSALENKDNWYIDFQEYFYGASKQVKKDERAVDVAGFCRRFGFERSEIRQWDWYDITKDTTLSLEVADNKVHEDWRNLYKFFLCWELFSASTKQLNPYLTRMDEDSGIVVEKTRDNCEIIQEGVKGDRFLTKFQICGVTTKRTSGFFHTFAPGADELSVVEAPEGKLLTYFDVNCDASLTCEGHVA